MVVERKTARIAGLAVIQVMPYAAVVEEGENCSCAAFVVEAGGTIVHAVVFQTHRTVGFGMSLDEVVHPAGRRMRQCHARAWQLVQDQYLSPHLLEAASSHDVLLAPVLPERQDYRPSAQSFLGLQPRPQLVVSGMRPTGSQVCGLSEVPVRTAQC